MKIKTNKLTSPHGIAGQVNIYILDVDSDITGYGAHNRLLVFGDTIVRTQYTVREDLRGLPLSTEAQRRTVLNGWQRLHGRRVKLVYVSSCAPYRVKTGGESIDHTYTVQP